MYGRGVTTDLHAFTDCELEAVASSAETFQLECCQCASALGNVPILRRRERTFLGPKPSDSLETHHLGGSAGRRRRFHLRAEKGILNRLTSLKILLRDHERVAAPRPGRGRRLPVQALFERYITASPSPTFNPHPPCPNPSIVSALRRNPTPSRTYPKQQIASAEITVRSTTSQGALAAFPPADSYRSRAGPSLVAFSLFTARLHIPPESAPSAGPRCHSGVAQSSPMLLYPRPASGRRRDTTRNGPTGDVYVLLHTPVAYFSDECPCSLGQTNGHRDPERSDPVFKQPLA
ncbi:hypothetical protein GGX14DRAFT_547152 [Mycena pura]|uniref:Uncharacterized protein n=1 Tax=Mycena pura TaxID=153505 RepID=A0AAD6ULQ9_9AGAR|nr:hypothetical protein GGX14DRAFT_547152 [Mycena pura]